MNPTLAMEEVRELESVAEAYRSAVIGPLGNQMAQATRLIESRHFQGQSARAFQGYMEAVKRPLLWDVNALSRDLREVARAIIAGFSNFESAMEGRISGHAVEEDARLGLLTLSRRFNEILEDWESAFRAARMEDVCLPAIDTYEIDQAHTRAQNNLLDVMSDFSDANTAAEKAAEELKDRIAGVHAMVRELLGHDTLHSRIHIAPLLSRLSDVQVEHGMSTNILENPFLAAVAAGVWQWGSEDLFMHTNADGGNLNITAGVARGEVTANSWLGETELSAGFLNGNVTLEVYEGEVVGFAADFAVLRAGAQHTFTNEEGSPGRSIGGGVRVGYGGVGPGGVGAGLLNLYGNANWFYTRLPDGTYIPALGGRLSINFKGTQGNQSASASGGSVEFHPRPGGNFHVLALEGIPIPGTGLFGGAFDLSIPILDPGLVWRGASDSLPGARAIRCLTNPECLRGAG